MLVEETHRVDALLFDFAFDTLLSGFSEVISIEILSITIRLGIARSFNGYCFHMPLYRLSEHFLVDTLQLYLTSFKLQDAKRMGDFNSLIYPG